MKTAHKIAIAKTAYHGLRTLRALARKKSDTVIAVRKGNVFELELKQGIDLAIFLGLYEKSTTNELTKLIKNGSTVLDIGANIGVHTLHMARLVGQRGKVYAFEPTSYAYHKLMTNLHLNKDIVDRVEAIQCFLSAPKAVTKPRLVYSSWPLSSVNQATLHKKHFGEPMPTDSAELVTVDDFLARKGYPAVSLVKLDVDGHESEVVSGAVEMIRRDRPTFIMEVAPHVLNEHGTSAASLLSFFRPFGYQFFEEGKSRSNVLSADEIIARVKDGAGMNVVAIIY